MADCSLDPILNSPRIRSDLEEVVARMLYLGPVAHPISGAEWVSRYLGVSGEIKLALQGRTEYSTIALCLRRLF